MSSLSCEVPPLRKQKIRLCSKKRPTTLFTLIFSDKPGAPGRNADTARAKAVALDRTARAAEAARARSSAAVADLRKQVEQLEARRVEQLASADAFERQLALERASIERNPREKTIATVQSKMPLALGVQYITSTSQAMQAPPWNLVMVGSILLTLPMIAVYYFGQRYLYEMDLAGGSAGIK